MHLNDRIYAFEKLGNCISYYIQSSKENKYNIQNSYNIDFEYFINEAEINNSFFIKEFIINSLEELSEWLRSENITNWLADYNIDLFENQNKKTIALILAGNLPLVGFHDILSILITGNKALIKTSEKDKILVKLLTDTLCKIEPKFDNYIEFTDKIISNFDAIIATGSNNSKRYFDYYFQKYPSIIRGNKNSIAILSGEETDEDLKLLADDIFLYFGLGCRSVSKIYIPQNYNFEKILKNFEKYQNICLNNNKYLNNYNYQKAILLVNQIPFYDNDFLLLVENANTVSPISVLNYEKYEKVEYIVNSLNFNQLQCVVSNINISEKIEKIGKSQKPHLNEYADSIDTIEFLINLK